jgi:hypothetical protein
MYPITYVILLSPARPVFLPCFKIQFRDHFLQKEVALRSSSSSSSSSSGSGVSSSNNSGSSSSSSRWWW